MIIANALRTKNRAEYLLYMWQVENIIRANNCDIEVLRRNYLSQFHLEAKQMEEMDKWYSDLCNMMIEEGVSENGHLQICKNIQNDLTELHNRLIASPNTFQYKELFYRVLPYIVELRSRNGGKKYDELQTCFVALYGIMMLRLRKQRIEEGTQKAADEISKLLKALSEYWNIEQEGKLEI